MAAAWAAPSAAQSSVLQANAQCSVSTAAGSFTCTPAIGNSSEAISSSTSTSSTYQGSEFVGEGRASVAVGAVANYGSLGVGIVGVAQSFAPPGNPFISTETEARANGSAEAAYTDWFVVSGATPGSFITIAYSVDVHGSVLSTQDRGGYTESNLRSDWTFGSMRGCWSTNLADTCLRDSISGTFEAVAGELNRVGMVLSAHGSAFTLGARDPDTLEWRNTSASLSVSFEDTLLSYFAPLEPSISLSFLSGHNYSPVAAIPEPETYAMMLAGLGMLAFWGRRRKPDRGLSA
jgi:hypothetical protein